MSPRWAFDPVARYELLTELDGGSEGREPLDPSFQYNTPMSSASRPHYVFIDRGRIVDFNDKEARGRRRLRWIRLIEATRPPSADGEVDVDATGRVANERNRSALKVRRSFT